MSTRIDTRYDDEIGAFVVRMPEFIVFNELKQWKAEFLSYLSKIEGQEKAAVLIDTNTHQFESIECLKLLREIFSEPKVIRCISKAAFVGPSQYRKPEIVSSSEGYFSSYTDAYRWLSS